MKNSMLFGLYYAGVGLAVGVILDVYLLVRILFDTPEFVYIEHESPNFWILTFPIFSTLSAFLISFTLWLIFIEKKKNYKISAGKKVGIVSAVLSHHFTFDLILIVIYVLIKMGLFGHSKEDLFQNYLFYTMLPTLISLILFGWITVPLGSLIGQKFANHLANSME